MFGNTVSLQAADKKVTINTCKLNAAGSQITVKAKVKSKPKGSKLYLLNLNANVSENGKKKAAPLASVKNKKGTVKFKVNYTESMLYQKFAVRFAQNDRYWTSLSFRPRESILKVDRKFSGSRRAIIHQRRSLVNPVDGELKLRMILDRFSVEVFVNDGEQVLSATMYTEQEADGISFFADGIAKIDVVKYELG